MKQILLLITIAISTSSYANNKDSVKVDRDVFTNLYFRAVNGAQWPIYMTPAGERYAVWTSKVNKKQHKYLIPKTL